MNKNILVPLTSDFMFKRIFTLNPNLLKEFLISVLKLPLNPETSSISIESNELPKAKKKEYHKTVDILVTINGTKIIDVELNSYTFEEVKHRNSLYIEKIMSTSIEMGTKNKDISNFYFYQLNLNIHKFKEKDIGEKIFSLKEENTGETLIDNLKIIYKSLDYYTNFYYTNKKEVSKDVAWLALINSKNFIELKERAKLIMNENDNKKFIKDVKDASNDKFILSEWEADKMAELLKSDCLENAKEEGKELGYNRGITDGIDMGIEQKTTETIKAMLKKQMSLEDISDVTGKTIQEIKEIEGSN